MRATFSAAIATAVAGTAGLALAVGGPHATASGDSAATSTFMITGDLAALGPAIARTGVDIESRTADSVVVTGIPSEIQALRALGLDLRPTPSSAEIANQRAEQVAQTRRAQGLQAQAAGDFPAGDEAYHTVAETTAALDKTVKTYPELASKTSMGKLQKLTRFLLGLITLALGQSTACYTIINVPTMYKLQTTRHYKPFNYYHVRKGLSQHSKAHMLLHMLQNLRQR